MLGAGWEDSVSGNLVNHNSHPPMFFNKCGFKRLSDPVSSLFATLTRDFIVLILKGLRDAGKWKGDGKDRVGSDDGRGREVQAGILIGTSR